jgi:DNA-binding beta-propeller fold protein YncE
MKTSLLILILLSATSCTRNYKHSPISHQNNISLKDIDFTKDFKTGKACATLDDGITFNGTHSIIDAAKNGNIKTVVFVDHTETKNFFQPVERCVLVYGN